MHAFWSDLHSVDSIDNIDTLFSTEAAGSDYCRFSDGESNTATLTNWITPLSQHQLLLVDGPDARKFLQGQISCDAMASLELASHGAYCTPQGRIFASFLLFGADENQRFMRMRRDIAASTVERMSKYIVFSKAELSASEAIGFALGGPLAAELLAQHFSLDKAYLSVTYSEALDAHCIQRDQDGLQFELWLSAEHALSFWQTARETLALANSQQAELCDIAAGIGEVCAATQEMFIPHMLNQPEIGAVSFTKGCYTGQEVVARMEYRGKSKRRMYRLAYSGGEQPRAGEPLFVAGSEQSIGNVVTSAESDGQYQLLAVLTKRNVEAGDAILLEADRQGLSLGSLPYAVDADES